MTICKYMCLDSYLLEGNFDWESTNYTHQAVTAAPMHFLHDTLLVFFSETVDSCIKF